MDEYLPSIQRISPVDFILQEIADSFWHIYIQHIALSGIKQTYFTNRKVLLYNLCPFCNFVVSFVSIPGFFQTVGGRAIMNSSLSHPKNRM